MIETCRMRRERSSPRTASDDRDLPLRHARSLARIALALLLTACSSIPAATVGPIAPAAPVVDVAPLPVPARTDTARRWNLHDTESRIDIDSGELMATFRSRVTRFRGTIAPSGDRATIDFDLRSLTNGSRVVTAIIQDDYLEVDKYPIAHLEVSIEGQTANGTLELHGVRRSIRFPVKVERTENRVRVKTAFTLKRHDFGIVRIGGWDWIAREDIGIDAEIVAAPERVTAEEVN